MEEAFPLPLFPPSASGGPPFGGEGRGGGGAPGRLWATRSFVVIASVELLTVVSSYHELSLHVCRLG